MTTEELRDMFDKHDSEFLKFTRIKNPAHRRPDLCAFLMLDAAVPVRGKRNESIGDMVSGAEHDEIYLAIGVDELAEVATDELIRDLCRCGVRYSEEYDCLAMFV